MQADDVGFFKQFCQRHILKTDLGGEFLVRFNVVGHYFHFKSPGDFNNIATNTANADHAQSFIFKVKTLQFFHTEIFAFQKLAPGREYFSGESQNQPEGKFGHRARAVSRHINHSNVFLPGAFKINMVKTGGTGGYEFQIRQGVHNGAADVVSHEYRYDIGSLGQIHVLVS